MFENEKEIKLWLKSRDYAYLASLDLKGWYGLINQLRLKEERLRFAAPPLIEPFDIDSPVRDKPCVSQVYDTNDLPQHPLGPTAPSSIVLKFDLLVADVYLMKEAAEIISKYRDKHDLPNFPRREKGPVPERGSESEITPFLMKIWVERKVIPYIELRLWSRELGYKINDTQIGELLFAKYDQPFTQSHKAKNLWYEAVDLLPSMAKQIKKTQ